ncbi:MAG TPA: hypothetical protein VJI12_04695 [archaeon]|nr:hypothetical protein [archaeon]
MAVVNNDCILTNDPLSIRRRGSRLPYDSYFLKENEGIYRIGHRYPTGEEVSLDQFGTEPTVDEVMDVIARHQGFTNRDRR